MHSRQIAARRPAAGIGSRVSGLTDVPFRAAAVPGVRPWSGHLSSWLIPLVAAVAITLLLELPHVIAGMQAQRGLMFVGMFWSSHDVSQYLAAMRDGAAGAWLVTDHLSGEPHRPAMMYSLYVVLGKGAAAAGIEFERAYMAAATCGRLLLLLAIYWATALVSHLPERRYLAFGLVVLGSGLTSLLGVAARLSGVPFEFAGAELNRPEVSTFLTLFTAPHLMIGLALMLGIARAVALAWDGSRAAAAAALTMALALGFANPFSLATICAVLAAFAAVQGILRAPTRTGILAISGVLAAASPFLLHSALVFSADPFWGATYGGQNRTLSDPPVELLLGLGLLVPLAMMGLRSFLRDLTPGRTLVMTWIVVSVVLMYLPVGFQRRFSFGLHPMLGMAAACGLPPVWAWLRRHQTFPGSLVRLGGMALLAQSVFGSTMFLYIVCVLGAFGSPDGVPVSVDAATDRVPFQPASLRSAATWLADRVGPDEIVLGHTITGNLLAGIMPGRVYVGHWVATLDFVRKQREAHWFFAAPVDDERLRFLVDQRIRYIVYGPPERALGATPPPPRGADIPQLLDQPSSSRASASLRLVYDTQGVAVYEVVSEAAHAR